MQQYPLSPNSPPPPRRIACPPRLGVSPTVVVLICLLLGLALGWGWGGEQAATRVAHSLDVTKTNLTQVQSRQSELTTLLVDAHSQIIHFRPADSAGTASAVLVWNASSGRGMLLCQDLWPLPKGQAYRLSAGDGETPTELATFTAAKGVTAIPFQIPTGDSFTHFELSAGGDKAPADQPLFTARRS